MEWTHKYLEIVRSLELNMAADRQAARVLERLISDGSTRKLARLIKGRPAIVYGCGPSLESDLNKIVNAGIDKKFISIAADGAVSACLRYKILPHVNVTDLDGNTDHIIYANRHGTMTVVHAHSDNVGELVKYMPKLKGSVLGTTHSDPTKKVHNWGGFTDGDRAVHIAEHFGADFIVLAGMDFGSIIGVHSGRYDKVRKPRNLKVGRMIIEDLAGHTNTKIFNMTHGGETIKNTIPITIEKLSHLVS